MNIQKNDILKLEIVDMNNLGAGVGKIDGAVVFVNGAVTGDVVEAGIIKVTKSYYVARVHRIVTPSENRDVAEFCKAPESCGGCVYRHLTRKCELEMKKNHIEGLFKKVGLDDVNILPVLDVSLRYGYRNKAQYPVCKTKDGVKAGFYANKTHTVIPYTYCSLEPDVFGDIVNAVCEFATKNNITVYDELSGKGLLRHIYLRRGEISGEIMLCLVVNGEKLPFSDKFIPYITSRFKGIVSVLLNVNKKNTNVVLGDKYIKLYGRDYIEDTLCGLTFRISPESFWQVNRTGAEKLYALGRELACLTGNENVLDLYCGTGTIGLSMASKAKWVTGVEIVEGAIACAKVNAEINGIENADFYCADASKSESIIPADKKYDVVILDPPRKGTTEELISYISKSDINRVVYISCGPDTLARDIVTFKKYGYIAGDVQPVDMFPATGHVESVVCLTRN